MVIPRRRLDTSIEDEAGYIIWNTSSPRTAIGPARTTVGAALRAPTGSISEPPRGRSPILAPRMPAVRDRTALPPAQQPLCVEPASCHRLPRTGPHIILQCSRLSSASSASAPTAASNAESPTSRWALARAHARLAHENVDGGCFRIALALVPRRRFLQLLLELALALVPRRRFLQLL